MLDWKSVYEELPLSDKAVLAISYNERAKFWKLPSVTFYDIPTEEWAHIEWSDQQPSHWAYINYPESP